MHLLGLVNADNVPIAVIHYAAPATILLYFVSASSVPHSSNSSPNPAVGNGDVAAASSSTAIAPRTRQSEPSALLKWLFVLAILTFVVDGSVVIARALIERGWWSNDDFVLYLLSSVFVYGVILVRFMSVPPVRHGKIDWPFLGTYLLSAIFSMSLLVLQFSTPPPPQNTYDYIHVTIASIRTALFLSLAVISEILRIRPISLPTAEEEAQAPLKANGGTSQYGTFDSGPTGPHSGRGGFGSNPPPQGGWITYVKSFRVFFPHLWPSKDRYLQGIIVFCFLLLMVGRVVNVLIPRQLGIVTDELTGESGQPAKMPWVSLLVYVFLRFMQGNMGIVGAIRSYMWIPIGQYSYRELSTRAFEHVHSLSLDFHITKKTGEVLSALSKGAAINTFLEQILFQIFPVIVDLALACVYFCVYFDAYFALIVLAVMTLYIFATIKITDWRTGLRRDMVAKSREEFAIKNDSISNYETVKYFNAEEYEFGRYREAVKTYQGAEKKTLATLNVMNITQGFIFIMGLLAATLLSAYRVSQSRATVGNFVTLLTYMAQLQAPLNFLGMYYRSIQSTLVDAERMLELFTQEPTIKDKPDAKDLVVSEGEIRFDHVNFSYDKRREALKDLGFVAPPGRTVALVGESGGGKSTILRLLFRFYDVDEGGISIDGQDLRDVKLHSLRKNIGIVPQDTVLFNETIMFNIRYAKPDATDEEVFDAARAAQIHDRILEFPDGYTSRVGERGLRLSGGERQRVAIARTILKNPKIIMLDEATSALDTMTERQIQAALTQLSKNRTTIVIAHRLSTITSADLILCVHAGEIVESGSHEELISRAERGEGPGMYWAMWQKQIKAEKLQRRKSQGEKDKDLESAVVTTDEEETDVGGISTPVQVPAVDGVRTGSLLAVVAGPSSSDEESVSGTPFVAAAVEDSGPSIRPSTAESDTQVSTSELIPPEETHLSRSSSQRSGRFSLSRSNSGGSGFAKLKESFRPKKGKETEETENLLPDPATTTRKKKGKK